MASLIPVSHGGRRPTEGHAPAPIDTTMLALARAGHNGGRRRRCSADAARRDWYATHRARRWWHRLGIGGSIRLQGSHGANSADGPGWAFPKAAPFPAILGNRMPCL